MIIKTDGFELEVSQDSDVYLGSKNAGQIFKKWSEIDDDAKLGLEKIRKEAEKLIRQSEGLILSANA
jgi:hypothetical protein